MAYFSEADIERLSASTVRMGMLAEFRFSTGTVRAWNGNYTLTSADGYQWLPMHGAGTVDGLAPLTGTESSQVTFGLSGLPDDAMGILDTALGETSAVSQRIARVLMQLFDADWQVAGLPIPLWFGYMQPPRVSRTPATQTSGASQTIALVAENVFYGRSRPPLGRLSDTDQKARSAGDRFCEMASSLRFLDVIWPEYQGQ